MTIDLDRLMRLRRVAVARLARDGTVRASNAAFVELFGPAGTVGRPVSRCFLSPSFADLRRRAEGGADVVHEGTIDVGEPEGTGTTIHALVLGAGDELLLLGEIGHEDYRRVADEVLVLNSELADLQREQMRTIEKLQRTEKELREALAQVRTLRGLLPICARCKKIKNDAGTWERLESYVERHTEAQLSHGLCRDCLAAELGDGEPPS